MSAKSSNPWPRGAVWILAATIVASSMTFIDMTVVNIALPVLQRRLGASFVEAQWVVEAYTLFLSALMLPGGALGDLYGRRRVFAIGILLFALASAACGLAPDPLTLIAARALQGVGGALLMPGSLAILSASFPPERQGYVIGVWSAASGIAVSIAPALGGWLIDAFSWRAVFLMNLPLAAVALAIVMTKVPESRSPGAGQLDIPVALLAIIGPGGLTLGLIQAGRAGFGDPLALGGIAIGLLGLASFIAVEDGSPHPMIPLALFRRRIFSAIQAFTFLLWAALSGALFFVPFRLMQIQGFPPIEAGASLLPFVVVISLLSHWAGRLVDRLGARGLLVTGSAVAGLGFLLLALPGLDTPYWLGILPALLVVGLGMGLCVAPVTVTALNAAGTEHVGLASAVNNMAARVGGLIAIAVFGILLADRFGFALDRSLAGLALPDAAVAALAPERAKLAAAVLPQGLSGGQQTALQAAIRLAFLDGYRWVMATAAVLALLSMAIAARWLGREGKG
jgi:EmrB/QacA subfamily drug resistance transporter